MKIISELAQKHQLAKFRLAYFYSEVDEEYLRTKIRAGDSVTGPDGFDAACPLCRREICIYRGLRPLRSDAPAASPERPIHHDNEPR